MDRKNPVTAKKERTVMPNKKQQLCKNSAHAASSSLLITSALLLVAAATSCVDVRPPPAVASDVLLICGQAPIPTAKPMVLYVLQGDVWMTVMTEQDFDLVMVDQDLLVGWTKCATEALASLR